MEYPCTHIKWKSIAKDGYPTREKFGPYPTVMVALACKGKPEYGYRKQIAELRFFGGDETRPYWCENGRAVIENSSWHVTHWVPALSDPI